MPPKVRGNDMPILPEFLRHPIPAAAMVPAAMQQDQGRSGLIAPVDIMEPEALRNVGLGSRSVYHAAIVTSLAGLVQTLRWGRDRALVNGALRAGQSVYALHGALNQMMLIIEIPWDRFAQKANGKRALKLLQ